MFRRIFDQQLSSLCGCESAEHDMQDTDPEAPMTVMVDTTFLESAPSARTLSRERKTIGSDAADEAAGFPHIYDSITRYDSKATRFSLDVPPSQIRKTSATGDSIRSIQSDNCMSTKSSFHSSDLDPFNAVRVDEEFDFYDPTTKQVQVMKMADVHDNVLHERETKSSSFFPSSPASETYSSDGSESGRLLQNSDSESDSQSDGLLARRNQKKKSTSVESTGGSFFDADAVTNWGTLTAKIVRRKVTGFSGAATTALHKRRHTRHKSEVQSRQYVLPAVRERAQLVVERARMLSKRVGQVRDEFDSCWMTNSSVLVKVLFGDEYIDTLMLLANTVRKVVSSQPVLAEAATPCRVFGDIHGQMRDLLIIFNGFGFPGDDGVSFVFNGDFVDRGRHSLEVVGTLFALKIMMPELIWLVRGNHEDRAMNERYGFLNDCYTILGREVGPKCYELMQRAFDELPLACLINERVFVVHGGLGDGKFSLNDIRAVERPLGDRDLASNPMVWNMLWSDPIEDDKAVNEKGVFGVHPSPRASTGIFKFGWNVTKTFCACNGLGLVIRSHQSKTGSLGFSLMHDKMLIRVFSARDYEEHGNDGAVILVSDLVKSDKYPNARKGQLIARPQVVRSVTKLQEGDGILRRRKPKREKTRKRSPS